MSGPRTKQGQLLTVQPERAGRHPGQPCRDGPPGHHRPAGPGEAALPQRRADQRHHRTLDQPLRPGAGARTRRPQARAGGRRHGQQRVHPHDLHQDHAREVGAGPDRSGVRPSLLGSGVHHRPADRVIHGLAGAEGRDRPPRAGRARVRPHRRLSCAWHTFTPGWAEADGIDDETLTSLSAERRSKVTFEIEDLGGSVKLTVVHDGFEPGGTARGMIQHGWPALLSSPKTLLATGDTLPAPA
ncbi:SRPBCC domain-containing protein [Streptomyces sp. NPDC048392]|uniref:SRPBCC domain-containing protein n=1 Tax=Streptomyces sp. NPDC048392 TaxID=3365543 RepID=UPI00371C6BF0